jgi:hypothetical protein
MTIQNALLDLAIMLVGSSAMAFLVCKIYIKNTQEGYQELLEETKDLPEYEEGEMRVYSTPLKKDKTVIRSKEIEDEEKS